MQIQGGNFQPEEMQIVEYYENGARSRKIARCLYNLGMSYIYG